MSEFLDWNPHRGTYYKTEYDHSEDKMTVYTGQDCAPVLEEALQQRNSGDHDKVGDFNRYAIIPAHVEVELRQKGINIYNQDQTPELLREINKNYPHLKVTSLTHDIKST